MNLTKSQQLIYDMEKFAGGTISIICGSMLLKGNREISKLHRVMNEIYRLNDALRIHISEDKGVSQCIMPFTEKEFEILSFETKEELDHYANGYAKIPMNLYGDLCETKIVILPDQYGVLVKLHHMVGDAWTLALLGNQFNQLLNGETPAAYSYELHVAQEEKYVQSKRYEKDKTYFLEQFKKCSEVTWLSEKNTESYAAERKTFVIDSKKAQKVTEYIHRKGSSAFMLFTAVLAAYMNRTRMNAEKFYIGTAILNRSDVKEKNTAGMFVNTSPMLIELDSKKTFGENLSEIEQGAFGILRHQKFNYGDVLASIRKEYNFNEKLYDVMLSYQNAAITGSDLKTTWYCCGMQTESLQFHIDDRDCEGIYRIHYDYLVDKFTEAEIERMHQHIETLLFSAIEEEEKPICELNIMPQEELDKVIYGFNNNGLDYPVNEPIHALFEKQAAATPDKTALIARDRTLSYGQLNELANQIAHTLIQKEIGANDIVAIALPRKSCLFAAMLGVLKAGAAYMPIDPNYPQDRIDYMLTESGAKLCITEENMDSLSENERKTNPAVAVDGDDLYCALHTSGSTGMPKMALLRHRNIRSFLAANERFFSEADTVVSATIVTFDAFIMDSVLSVAMGRKVVLASEEEIYNQSGFEKLFDHSDRNMFFSTPTKIENYITNSETKQFLSKIKSFIVGGEVFGRPLLELIKEGSPDSRVFNIYGPTEAAICVTVDELSLSEEITIGTPTANTQVYIVDIHGNPVPVGVTGELCIAGSNVGAGYANKPELTEEKFVENPFGTGKMYKTGDLASWREDGRITYIGRNDFQVKIRGLRIELGEIENAICGMENIEQAVVVVRKNEEGRQVICAFYTGQETDAKQIRMHIGQKLPRYMVPHIFTWLSEMPLTPSGKISRTALPAVDLYSIDLSVEYVAPVTTEEKVLAQIVKDVLGTEKVGVLDNFFDLGGDSLKGIELISALENAGYHVDNKTIFECETIKELAEKMETVTDEAAHLAEFPEITGDIPASSAQIRVFTAQGMNPDSTMYNVPYAFQTENLDEERLEAAIQGLLERHEILRTKFENRDGRIIQVVDDTALCSVEKLKSSDLSSFIRPFKLEKAPLIRVGYFDNTVIIDMHHIITDGGSMPVFLHELNELYMGRALKEKPIPYKYFAVEEKDYSESENYWLSVFHDEVPVVELNTDYKQNEKQTFHGSAFYDVMDMELHQQIQRKCRELNITPFVFYMAGFKILLSKFSGGEDIVVGMPMSGRSGKYLNSIGMFVNTVALRSQPAAGKTVKEFLSEVKESSVNALIHQEYPYGELVKKLKLTPRRNPLFDVMFAYQSEEMTQIVFGDRETELLPIPVTSSKYDITFNVMPRSKDMVVMVEYCTDLYKESTMKRMADSYKYILNQLLDTEKVIREISAVPETEEETILRTFNATNVPYDKECNLVQLFEKQVERKREENAVFAMDCVLSYEELNEQANRIGHSLVKEGVCPGDIVAFALPRTSKLIAAMFGILKAGAAYLPVDPDYPKDRVEYMLTDSKAGFFITEENIDELLAGEENRNPGIYVAADSLCYCIYTSGSTGKPKAVAISHKNAHNFVLPNGGQFQTAMAKDCDCVFATNAVVFDITVQDILFPLLNGKFVLFADTENISKVTKLLVHARIGRTALIITPTKLQMYMQSREFCENLYRFSVIMVGAENFPENLYYELRKYTKAKIFNGYGPTETTCGVLYAQIKRSKKITIGKPVANTQIYIVDSNMDITPVGVTGELCIAGDSVGMGYLYRPELTDEKFVPNPFGEGKLYKTGDLAYWQEDGNIVYVGRNDFQVKIRGLRIELGEIENAMCTMDSIAQAVVDVRKNREGRQIICAFYTGEEVEGKEIRFHIGKILPKYMVPHIFTRIETLPMTAGGKVNKKALPEVDLYNTDYMVEYVAPETKREKALTAAAADVLGIERVGLLDNFFDLGGDSMKALELISRLDQMGYQTDSKTIFECDTVGELAEQMVRIEQEMDEDAIPEGDIPATDAQMRVYTAQGMANDSTTYNVTFVFRTEELDAQKLQHAVNSLVERHEILRTRFENREGTIFQVADDNAVCRVEALSSDEIGVFVRPFDLSQAPLLRVGYYGNIVMVDMHHIITDGSSMPVFIRELNEFYMGRTLERPTVPYRAFAVQNQNFDESEKYWLSVYNDEPPVLELNTDFKPGNKQTFNGSGVYDMVSDQLHKQITSKCKELNVTPYVFYMGAFNILLSKFSGNEDIVVGMPISGRSTKFLNTIGMFVNTIALRSQPAGTKTVREFLLEVKENTVHAMEHQDYPYGDLVKKLNLPSTGRNPLFDVMLAYQSEEMTEVIFGDKKAELLPLPITTSKYDITFSVLPQEDKVILLAEYCTDLYLEETMKRMMEGFKQILVEILDFNKELKDISVLTEEAKEQILETFNGYEREYKKNKCVHELFEEQVAMKFDQPALIAPDRNMTYGELNAQANQIAHSLIDMGIRPGDIAAFALPRKSYMISVIFGILKAGAAYLPVDPGYPQDRIDYMLSDSDAKIFITQENIDQLLSHENTENPCVSMTSDHLCYCIYTSGSTGKPKGTMLRHSGIVNLMTDLSIYGDMSACKRFGFMTTITFDVASQEILTAYLNGYMGVLMPERRETKTDTIIKGIVEHKIDMIYATSTYLDSLTNTKEKADALASAAKMCILAGEAFQINPYLAAETGVKFHNQYGPAETHVVTASMINDLNDIHIGKPVANTQIYILDKYLNPVPIGVTGELYIAGDCVGAGYLKRPELTRERFLDNPFGKGKIYKTGDLAFWRPDGNIAYIGRNDFQVKIRGQRIELGEIENAMCSMSGIAQAVVVVRKNAEGRQIICAFYTGKEMEAKEIRRFIGRKLPKYMVPHIFTFLNEMPLTASGKISRTALPEIDLYNTDMSVEYIAPQTEKEIILAEACKEVLGAEKVGMLDNFFDLGGDSLKGIELISKLEAAGYVTDAKAIFECDTMKELADKLEKAEITNLEFNYEGDIPATAAQMRIYTAQSMNADITSYNVPYIFKVAMLDPKRLQSAIDTLVKRHEIFRTWFKNDDGHIVQVIEKEAKCQLEKLESDDMNAFVRPFRMNQAPLLRVGYYENIVMIDMHHTITDGGSMPVFLQELNELYMGRELTEEPVQYKLFAVQKPDYSKSKNYWLSVFHDEPPVLEMNTDFKPGQKQSFRGNAVYEVVMPDLHNKILEKCKEMGITPYVFYMTGFNVLLSKFSGCEDIVVGMPMSGRSGRFINTIGMFVNTIALRNQPVGAKTVKEFINEVKENSVNAIAHQDYPFGKLVKKLHIENTGRNPLFDVMFAYQSEETTRIIFGDKEAELLPMPVTTSKYDFTFNIMPKEDHAIVMVEYCTDLYKESTMKRMAESYKHILFQLLDEEQKLEDITGLTEEEERKVLVEFNDTDMPYPEDECLHQLFEKHAKETPDKTAVIAIDQTVTYGQLNILANRIAHSLLERGIEKGDIVAVSLPRRTSLFAAMLGALKAGAAYMPIDPNYPQDRIDYMLGESKAKICITEANVEEMLACEKTYNPEIPMKGDDYFCALHTSGSTGMPKMALLLHRGLRNFLSANQHYWRGIDTVVSVTIITFDAFIVDSVLTMAQGCQVVLADEEDIYNQAKFEKLFEHSERNMFFSTPTKLENYISNSETKQFLSRIKNFMVGGEVFNENLLAVIKSMSPDCTIINSYGPTEATICIVVEEVLEGREVTIGRPTANSKIYIVDKNMALTPIGVTGELCIGGAGVGAGYINRPELTREVFIDNPFGEGKIYRTGDLAYWREDGRISYVGRNDFQVKIRGLRIELGEIETAMCSMEPIAQAVVVVRKNSTGRQIICAFYTGKEVETKEIRLHIGKGLPKYMIPHIFTYLPELPQTSNGKIDRKALPEIDLENITNETEYVAPRTNLQMEICKILEAVLEIKPIGLLDNFFDLGGDSLKAIEFVSKAHNEGIYFNLQNVFDYATVEDLCSFIEKGDEETISFEDVDYTRMHEVISTNEIKRMERPKRKDVGNILLSGATGYLGIHILANYLHYDSGIAYCLVRGENLQDSEKRLKNLMNYYFGHRFDNTERIQVICADLSKDMFGMEEEAYKELFTKVDTVINTAASVKHYGSYKYFYEANVESVKRMIAFCQESGAKLIHTSTLSVSGTNLIDEPEVINAETITDFTERNLYIGQILDNVYIRSKFEAEMEILTAMSEGLKANIMRIGNLTNRSSDGLFQKNHESNAFLQRMRAVLALGVFPDYLLEYFSEFTPVDEAAQAVMTITRHFREDMNMFHITNVKLLRMKQLGEYFTELGYPLTACSGAAFTAALMKTANQKGREFIFEAFINDIDENNQLSYLAAIHTINKFTEQYLAALGFEWSEIGLEYLQKYLEHFKKVGYLEDINGNNESK